MKSANESKHNLSKTLKHDIVCDHVCLSHVDLTPAFPRCLMSFVHRCLCMTSYCHGFMCSCPCEIKLKSIQLRKLKLGSEKLLSLFCDDP